MVFRFCGATLFHHSRLITGTAVELSRGTRTTERKLQMIYKLIAAFTILNLFVTTSITASTLRIGVYNQIRGEDLALDGTAFGNQVETYVSANIPGADFIGTPALTPEFLATVDMVLINTAESFSDAISPLTASEEAALLAFINAGNGAIIVADGSFGSEAQSFVDPFGASIRGSEAGVPSPSSMIAPLSSPISNGPYGLITTYFTERAFLGDLFPYVTGVFHDIGPYAVPLGKVDATNEISIAYIPENGLATGSGRVVFFTDADTALGSLENDDGLFLNAIAYAAVPVPEPHSIALAGMGFLAFATVAARSRRKTIAKRKFPTER